MRPPTFGSVCLFSVTAKYPGDSSHYSLNNAVKFYELRIADKI